MEGEKTEIAKTGKSFEELFDNRGMSGILKGNIVIAETGKQCQEQCQ